MIKTTFARRFARRCTRAAHSLVPVANLYYQAGRSMQMHMSTRFWGEVVTAKGLCAVQLPKFVVVNFVSIFLSIFRCRRRRPWHHADGGVAWSCSAWCLGPPRRMTLLAGWPAVGGVWVSCSRIQIPRTGSRKTALDGVRSHPPPSPALHASALGMPRSHLRIIRSGIPDGPCLDSLKMPHLQPHPPLIILALAAARFAQ